MQIKNFILDMGNVLVDLDYSLWQENLNKILNPHSLDDIMPLIHKYDTGIVSTELFINGALKLCSHRIHALDVIQAWNSLLIGIDEQTLNTLEQMKDQFQLALLSNNNPLHQQWVYQYSHQRYGIESFDDFFHYTFYSHEIRQRKPLPECYKYVQESLDWNLEETLFVDDKEENIVAARSQGWLAYLFKPQDSLQDAVSYANSL